MSAPLSLQVACPVCHAEPGMACIRTRGRHGIGEPMITGHVARERARQAAVLARPATYSQPLGHPVEFDGVMLPARAANRFLDLDMMTCREVRRARPDRLDKRKHWWAADGTTERLENLYRIPGIGTLLAPRIWDLIKDK